MLKISYFCIMFGIKKLDLYVIKNFCLLFAGTFFVCLFVFMMQFLWKYVDDLIGKGLTLDVMAEFFFYAALTLIPTSLPLAILLAALISFGNLGEKFELLAIKAAGISLIKVLRPLIFIVTVLGVTSFYFQNVVAPNSWNKLYTLLWSMRQSSPELDIPEGAFYSDIQGYNVYVKKKDKETGWLKDITIYSFTEGFENAHIIVADSGRLDMSADKQHLILSLFSGEQFENLQSAPSNSINIPYRRETFVNKQTIIAFDGGFQMQDAGFLSARSDTKDMWQIKESIDSMETQKDSLHTAFYTDMKQGTLKLPESSHQHIKENNKDTKTAKTTVPAFDTIWSKLPGEAKISMIQNAKTRISNAKQDLEFKQMIIKENNKQIAAHWANWHRKITMSLACLVFFFIGAPLGAIIRKGGLGLPVIISVVIFIIYYIIDNTAYRQVRSLQMAPWMGMWLSTAILTPVGAWLTYKANKDSTVFNMDMYRSFLVRVLGLRTHRTISMKEVIIETPEYPVLKEELSALNEECKTYAQTSHLLKPPSYFKIFWKSHPDSEVASISEKLESIIEKLSNSRNRVIISALNEMPILVANAHTSPFKTHRRNIAAGIFFPLGVFFFFRIWRYRFRLLKDMRQIVQKSDLIQEQINLITAKNSER